MMKSLIGLIGLLFSTLFYFGCTHGHCNRQGKSDIPDSMKKILIFKYDGSKQCELDSGISENEMVKELLEIKIYSAEKKSDRQPRVQVCGALTGQANVYKIKAENLPLAEALGFKKWDF